MNLATMILACSVHMDNAIVQAMVNTESDNHPWVISGQPFATEQQALAQATKFKSQGKPFEIGLMQLPSFWLTQYQPQSLSMSQLLRPCKNMQIATQILHQALVTCDQSMTCALSVYKTGDKQSPAGMDYATQIMQYAQSHPF